MGSARRTPRRRGPRLLRVQVAFKTPKTSSAELAKRELSVLKIPPSPCLKRLGYGTGVNVFLYERSPLRGQILSPWAIKKANRAVNVARRSTGSDTSGGGAGGTDMITQRMEKEAEILRKLKHPNIIGFRGFKRTSDGSRILAIENGQRALFDIIEDRRDSECTPLAANFILIVIRSVASALDYLHREKRILHGDMKSGNVLIIGDFKVVKICEVDPDKRPSAEAVLGSLEESSVESASARSDTEKV